MEDICEGKMANPGLWEVAEINCTTDKANWRRKVLSTDEAEWMGTVSVDQKFVAYELLLHTAAQTWFDPVFVPLWRNTNFYDAFNLWGTQRGEIKY